MRQKELEIFLSQIETFKAPKIALEQYQTPPRIAALITWRALQLGDIKDKVVADFCCGTGIFAIAAALLGAKSVFGFDIDSNAIDIAKENAKKLGVIVNWQVRDIRTIEKKFDTVLMNSPFGVKSSTRDRVFLKAALQASDVTYSLHLYLDKNIEFLRNFIKKNGKKVSEIMKAEFELPYLYSFHKKRYHLIKVAIIRSC